MQSLFYFDQYYSWIVVIITGALLIFKKNALLYPSGQFAIEALILTGYAFLSYAKLKSGFKGNKIESIPEMLVLFVLGAFCIFTNAYFLAWQTYIMMIELVLHLAAVGFTGAEMLLGLFQVAVFSSLDKRSK